MKNVVLTAVILLFAVAYSQAQTCNGSLTVTIEGSSTGQPLSATETHSNLSCNASSGSANGSIDLTPAGGTPPYTFDWADIMGTDDGEDRSSLAAGSYSVTITDANSCTSALGPITLTQPTAVTVTGVETNLSCNAASGAADGAIDITPGGGTVAGNYSFAWSTSDGSGLNATGEDQTGLSAGTYTVTVSDDNSCTAVASFTLTEPTAVVCTASSPTVGSGGTNILCSGGTGTISVSASGGTGTYTYSIDGGSFQSSGSFSGVLAGSHTITVKDQNDCSSTCSVTLTEPTPLVAGTCDYVQDICQLEAGEIKVEASGGTPPYSVSWTATPIAPNTTAGDFDQASPQTINSSGGSFTFTGADGKNQYSFIVTDANGCEVP